MPTLETVTIIDDGKALSLGFTDGTTLRFHGIWLRDNAPDNALELQKGEAA